MSKVKPIFRSLIIGLTLTIAWMATAIFLPDSVLKAIISSGFLLFVPGYYLYRVVTQFQKTEPWKLIGYSLGLSIILLILTGLAVNQGLLLLGNSTPLTTEPLSLAIGGLSAALVIGASFIARPEKTRTRLTRHRLITALQASPLYIFGAILPLLAAGGAITLNNGGSNWLALLAMGLVGLYLLLIIWKARHKVGIYPYALYMMTLTILLGTSLRGWNITGHDIMQEYQVFQLTVQHAAWHMQYYQDAYMACLSITILPTVLRDLTGIADPYIFKLLFQLVFAFLPPIIYLTVDKYVTPRVAMLAGFVFISFPTFLTDITMLNRQEIAFLFLGLSLLAGLDQLLGKRQRLILVFIFLVGVVLSHYSTSYLALSTLVIAGCLQFGLTGAGRIFGKPRKALHKEPYLKIYTWPIIIGSIAVLLAWNVLATQTAGNISATIRGVYTAVPSLLTGKGSSRTPASQMTLAPPLQAYVTSATASRPLPAASYYPTSTTSQPLTPQTAYSAPESSSLAALSVPSAVIHRSIDLVRQAYALLIVGLLVISALMILWLRTKLPRQYLIVGIASLCMVGLQVVLPSNLVDYGLERSIQQSLLFLSVPVIVVVLWLLQKLHIAETWRHRLVALGLTSFFLVLSGFVPALTGSYNPALALSNSGFYYDAYYTHQDAVSADHWLATQTPKGSQVYSDEFTRRQLITYGGIFAQPSLLPSTIPVDSYVYLSYSNTTTNSVPLYYNGQLLYYAVPADFLNTNKNLVYSSANVLIFK